MHMKSSFVPRAVLFLLFSLGLIGWRSAQATDIEAIFKIILEADLLGEELAQSDKGELLPLIILTHHLIPQTGTFQQYGQTVHLYASESQIPTELHGLPVIEVQKSTIKPNKARLELRYQGAKIKTKLRQRKGTWRHKKFIWKREGDVRVDFQF